MYTVHNASENSFLYPLPCLVGDAFRSGERAGFSPAYRDWSQTLPAQRFRALTITVKNAGTGAVRTVSTDNSGRYQVPALARGGLRDPRESLQVSGGSADRRATRRRSGCDGRFEPAHRRREPAGDREANASIVNVATADISGLVGEQQVRDLPLNGRSYDELLTLNPGVVNFTFEKTGGVGVSNSTSGNNFAVSGNRPQQNLFLLNGVEFTGAAENNMQPGGVSQELLGVDAVQEFNVLRDSYGAEYGKRPGAQVLIVTQSGTNQVHGSLYEFIRNNDLDARNFFDGASAPGFQRNQFGGSIGAPIKKDKTFVFANFEGLQQHLHQTGVDLVPDTNARAGIPALQAGDARAGHLPGVRPGRSSGVSPLINLWPAPSPGAPDFGGIAEAFNNPLQTIRDDFGTARVDHIFSEKDQLSVVYTMDDSADFTPTSTNLLQHRRRKPARTSGEHRRNPHFLADLAEHRSLRLFARRLFLYR